MLDISCHWCPKVPSCNGLMTNVVHVHKKYKKRAGNWRYNNRVIMWYLVTLNKKFVYINLDMHSLPYCSLNVDGAFMKSWTRKSKFACNFHRIHKCESPNFSPRPSSVHALPASKMRLFYWRASENWWGKREWMSSAIGAVQEQENRPGIHTRSRIGDGLWPFIT